jgi:hypothetical protein
LGCILKIGKFANSDNLWYITFSEYLVSPNEIKPGHFTNSDYHFVSSSCIERYLNLNKNEQYMTQTVKPILFVMVTLTNLHVN